MILRKQESYKILGTLYVPLKEDKSHQFSKHLFNNQSVTRHLLRMTVTTTTGQRDIVKYCALTIMMKHNTDSTPPCISQTLMVGSRTDLSAQTYTSRQDSNTALFHQTFSQYSILQDNYFIQHIAASTVRFLDTELEIKVA